MVGRGKRLLKPWENGLDGLNGPPGSRGWRIGSTGGTPQTLGFAD